MKLDLFSNRFALSRTGCFHPEKSLFTEIHELSGLWSSRLFILTHPLNNCNILYYAIFILYQRTSKD